MQLPPELEASIVAGQVEQTFGRARELLLAAIKEDGLVQAVNDFAFDPASRTMRLDIASVFDVSEDATFGLLYKMASDLSALAWAPEIADHIRPESLPSFLVTVDDMTFRCPGPAMAALADKELSDAAFKTACARG